METEQNKTGHMQNFCAAYSAFITMEKFRFLQLDFYC